MSATSHRHAAAVLGRWVEPSLPPPSLLVVAAHPDDDVLGVGGQLPRVAGAVHVAIVSDGAPNSPGYYRSLGFERREDYARARKAEALQALQRAGVPEGRVHLLGYVDQTLARGLATLVPRLCELVAALAPEAVMTHPYEGGHPDHDATACAVHAAVHELERRARAAPALLEFASYHARGEGLAFGEFIPDGSLPSWRLPLDASARLRKRGLLDCHATQRAVWRDFPLDAESFRVAPRYDFRAPPAAPFHYDRVAWGMTGRELGGALSSYLTASGIRGHI